MYCNISIYSSTRFDSINVHNHSFSLKAKRELTNFICLYEEDMYRVYFIITVIFQLEEKLKAKARFRKSVSEINALDNLCILMQIRFI